MSGTEKSKVDIAFCARMLERGITLVTYDVPFKPLQTAVFLGLAKHWHKFTEPDFQKFMSESRIFPNTSIVVWELGRDAYEVARRIDMDRR
jgi:hypothetical protein